MENSRYTLLVKSSSYGKYKIQLTDNTIPSLSTPEGHGSILVELCTYEAFTMRRMLAILSQMDKPMKYINKIAKTWNTDLDNAMISVNLDKKKGIIKHDSSRLA